MLSLSYFIVTIRENSYIKLRRESCEVKDWIMKLFVQLEWMDFFEYGEH